MPQDHSKLLLFAACLPVLQSVQQFLLDLANGESAVSRLLPRRFGLDGAFVAGLVNAVSLDYILLFEERVQQVYGASDLGLVFLTVSFCLDFSQVLSEMISSSLGVAHLSSGPHHVIVILHQRFELAVVDVFWLEGLRNFAGLPVAEILVLGILFGGGVWELRGAEFVVGRLLFADAMENFECSRLWICLESFLVFSELHYKNYSFEVLYNFIMLTLSNLTLVLTQPNTLYITNKELKITAGTTTTTTKSLARSSGQNQIIWDDVLTVRERSILNFQVTTKHQFGYNPEELNSVIQGTIKVEKGRSDGKLITSTVYNLEGQKVGYLKVNLRGSASPKHSQTKILATSHLSIPTSSKLLAEPESRPTVLPESLMVTSVIAHADKVKGRKIHLKLKWSKSVLATEQFSSKSGEIVFIGNYELKDSIQSPNKDTQLVVELFDNETQQLRGTAIFYLDSLGKLTKKGVLKDDQGRELGDMFIEGKLISIRYNRYANRSVLQIRDHSSPKDSLANSLVKSSAHMKRSVVNSNNSIKFSKEVRFFGNLQDKKSPYVSYQDPGSLEFKQPRTQKFYRGASIGRGAKYDFTCEGVNKPGVGQYFLPSIWDRY